MLRPLPFRPVTVPSTTSPSDVKTPDVLKQRLLLQLKTTTPLLSTSPKAAQQAVYSPQQAVPNRCDTNGVCPLDTGVCPMEID